MPASQEAVLKGQPSEKKERAHTNNGAKRKQHLEVEVVEENVDPEDPRFNKDLARLYKTRDVIRYELIPMRFIKKVYHVRTYTQNDEYFSGKAPTRRSSTRSTTARSSRAWHSSGTCTQCRWRES